MAKKATQKKRASAASRRRVTKRAPARASRRASARPARRRAAAARPKRRVASSATRPAARPADRHGLITHTEIASTDPLATKEWCREVLGWQFGPPMATPSGEYHPWMFANGTGGGIRAHQPPESPGTIPYCEVPDIQAAFAKALERGAIEVYRPEALPGGMGWIAIVSAPGGVAIGFWAKQ